MNQLISIITPVYNVEKFIAETIESVLKQTYSNWELILVDDGSTDGSTEICKLYALKDERIKYFYKTNGGQASARNLGIKKAKGEYVTFLDSDDLYCFDNLESHLVDLEDHPADFYYGAGYILNENQKKEDAGTFEWVYGEFKGLDFFKIIFPSCLININSVFAKKELFISAGLFNEGKVYRGTEDGEFWLRLSLKVDKVYGNPVPKVYYRIHSAGIHFQKANMYIGRVEIYKLYENHNDLSALFIKRGYRYVYRELFNHLNEEDRVNEIKDFMLSYFSKDKYGLISLVQSICIRFLSIKALLWFSNTILYRIGYRIENLRYKLFLNE